MLWICIVQDAFNTERRKTEYIINQPELGSTGTGNNEVTAAKGIYEIERGEAC
jgi:hypothetical protein